MITSVLIILVTTSYVAFVDYKSRKKIAELHNRVQDYLSTEQKSTSTDQTQLRNDVLDRLIKQGATRHYNGFFWACGFFFTLSLISRIISGYWDIFAPIVGVAGIIYGVVQIKHMKNR